MPPKQVDAVSKGNCDELAQEAAAVPHGQNVKL